MNSSYKRLSKNALLVFIGKAGSSLISLLMLPLYTIWLTPGEYGSVDLINTYSTILISIISCCIADAIFVIPDRKEVDNVKSYFTTGLLFLCIVSLLSCGLVSILSMVSDSNNFVINNRWNIILLSLSMMWLNYMQQFCRTQGKMNIFSFTGIIQTLSIAVLSLVLIPSFGLYGYVDALILSCLISSVFSFLTARSYRYISLNTIQVDKLWILLKYSIPLMPNSIMWWLVNGFNRPFMESILGLSAIGLYAVAMKFPSLITSVCDVFMNAFSISMIEEYGKPTFHSFFNNVFRLCIVGCIILAMFVSIFARPIIGVFAAEGFLDAWRLLPVLTLSSVFSCGSGIVGGVFIAWKKSKYFFYSSIWGAISSVILTVIFINIWGIMGCAIAVCSSFGIMFMVRLYYAWKEITGFDIFFYFIHFIALIFVILVSLTEISLAYKIIGYIVVVGYVLYKNVDLIKVLSQHIRKFINR